MNGASFFAPASQPTQRRYFAIHVLQQLINGLSQGSIYALMAIGYTLIVGVVGLITFAYGEMVMIGAISAYLFYTYVTPTSSWACW